MEDVSGPCSLTSTRAIIVNKGLTPHQPKSVWNPRVKKQQKFEKVKRKFLSQKAVYRNGISGSGLYSKSSRVLVWDDQRCIIHTESSVF
jgi:hypothetical protein